jgi:hypothetical protein
LDKNKIEIDKLKSEITSKEKEVNTLYETYITEAEGTAGTKKLGKGPVLKKKWRNIIWRNKNWTRYKKATWLKLLKWRKHQNTTNRFRQESYQNAAYY